MFHLSSIRVWAVGIAFACSLGAGVAHAQGDTPAAEIGHATSALLDLQRSNRAAATPQPIDGAAGTFAYQRYIDSFKTPIPQWFGTMSASGGGSGGGSGGLSGGDLAR
ncbi:MULTISPECIES: DUF3613 domain-containing protein [Burkholderia]|uniref:DUF3613 domain-containing protein n=1 Tax=Burkholderia TaxID=32008 RepID=UPI000678D2C4|nr:MULTISPECIES: DUF3613 domain-containing protein [Burkholderia]KWU23250.1 hypothetical protein AS149_10720 [Burkholderia cenocepacia]OXI76295.1 hypothetical protein CFB44_07595 [Burkholderia sp. AU31280]QRR13290.1 DUF3613 domain-containing protein [Burkholderia sp. MS389]RQU41289.1 DUF3613 domain-containing protein [Burkholderia cenocepacia]RQU86445.1 DUF3613 domain-containing protein [Burkholderia cenocepacia]